MPAPEVVHVTDCYAGGVRTHIDLLLEHVPGRHRLVLLRGRNHLDAPHARDAPVLPFRRRWPLGWPGAARRLARLVPEGAVVHAHSTFAGWVSSLAVRRGPLAYSPHAHFGLIPTRGPVRWGQLALQRWERAVLPDGATLVASGDDEERLVRRLHPRNPVVRIDHALPPRAGSDGRGADARADPRGLDGRGGGRRGTDGARDIDFLFLGRLDAQKRPERFLRMAQALPGRRFVLAGAGPLRADLERQRDRAGLRNLEIPGFVEDAHAAMARAKVFVLTSAYEVGVPYVALEALQAGCRLACLPAPGTRDVVARGLGVATDGSPASLEAALEAAPGLLPADAFDRMVRGYADLYTGLADAGAAAVQWPPGA